MTQTEPKTYLRSFLGLCSIRRRFAKDFVPVSAPQHKQLKKRKPQVHVDRRTNVERQKFKMRFKYHPLVEFPREDKTEILEADANTETLGCFLLQEKENRRHVLQDIAAETLKTRNGIKTWPNASGSRLFRPFSCYKIILKALNSR